MEVLVDVDRDRGHDVTAAHLNTLLIDASAAHKHKFRLHWMHRDLPLIGAIVDVCFCFWYYYDRDMRFKIRSATVTSDWLVPDRTKLYSVNLWLHYNNNERSSECYFLLVPYCDCFPCVQPRKIGPSQTVSARFTPIYQNCTRTIALYLVYG